MLDPKFDDFWNWFTNNSNQLHSNSYNTAILNQLDKTISSWSLGWEIGPGFIKENSFTISPNGDKELLEQTEKIISYAPILDNWEFYSSKQPKENWNIANVYQTIIEADQWTYSLLKYPENEIEIIIQADNLDQFDNSVKQNIVDLILTNLLGEKRKIEELDFIDIVAKHENDNPATKLKFLALQLDNLKKGI